MTLEDPTVMSDDLPEPDAPGLDDQLPGADSTARRAADLRLARLHLRLGGFLLARAELEAANEHRALSDGSLLDLAEVRWRTGDLAGAGRAAEAGLAEDPDGLLATVIAAEAALVDGRPSDANDLAARALDLAAAHGDATLGTVFAGMPRSALWPADPLQDARSGIPDGFSAGRPGSAASRANAPRPLLEPPGAAGTATGSGRGGASAERPDADPLVELAAAETDLEAGDLMAAAIRLGVVLRLAPALAPAVLELLRGVPGPLAALIRGDAYRLVGREAEAEQAYAEATQRNRAEPGTPVDPPRQANPLEDSP